MDSKIQFDAHEGRPISKWGHYFPVYDMFLHSFVGRPTQILEIGIWKGGSLQFWRKVLGPYSKIIGIDIDKSTQRFNEPDNGYFVEIGDQSDINFLEAVLSIHGVPDIVLDDGSHVPSHQIASFEYIWPRLRPGAIYMVEDIKEVVEIESGFSNNAGSFHEYISCRAYSVSSGVRHSLPISDLLSVFLVSGMVVLVKGRAYDAKSVRGGDFKRLREIGASLIDKLNG
jgi:hypothetical protein